MTTEQIPEGYLKDSKDRLVPISTIDPIDIERNDLVLSLLSRARNVHQVVADFKADAFGDIAAMVQLSAEQYGVEIGGTKGNVTLTSYDGKLKVKRAIAEVIAFDERLQAAKALVDECIIEWGENIHPNIRALVNDAFQVDKEGKISVGKVLGLRRHKFPEDKWKRAMQAIADAVHVVDSKSYVRFYERTDAIGEWKPIVLNVASA